MVGHLRLTDRVFETPALATEVRRVVKTARCDAFESACYSTALNKA